MVGTLEAGRQADWFAKSRMREAQPPLTMRGSPPEPVGVGLKGTRPPTPGTPAMAGWMPGPPGCPPPGAPGARGAGAAGSSPTPASCKRTKLALPCPSASPSLRRRYPLVRVMSCMSVYPSASKSIHPQIKTSS